MGPKAAAGAEAACQSPEAFAAWTEELLGLEHEAEDEETTELLVTCTQAELQARGIAVLKLVVAEQTTALYGRTCLTLERPGGVPLPVHRITHGDIVGLFDQGTRPLSKAVPLASAVVQRVAPGAIFLAFDGDVPVDVLDGRQLNLAAVSSEVTMRRYREALDLLKSGRPDGPAAGLVAFCFSEGEEPRFREAKSELCGRPDAVDCAFRAEQSHNLNAPQQAAVVRALCAVDMAVIHGPPGTGKTTTLVAYILEAVYRKQRLLVTAPSNVAVDNLLERVVDCGCRSVVRLGHPARVQSELHRYTMDNVVYASEQAALCRDIKKEIDDALKRLSGRGKAKDAVKVPKGELTALRKELRQRERRAVAEVLRHTQVVFATCAGAATLHREIRRAGAGEAAAGSLEFDVVIIDEAAQALEVACWIPLLLGRKAVLAGDHQQLAATVKSDEAQRRGLDRTLFGRMVERHGDKVAALLSIQYRMNATIMGWSSSSFYGSRLEAAESVATRTLALSEVPAANLVGDTLEAMRAPLLFVDTGGLALYREDGQEEAEESGRRATAVHAAVHQSRANPGEARFLVHYAKMLARCGVAPKDMTVITPYNRQVERARAEFAGDAEAQKLGVDKPRVNTVDSFQGQEADAVLISLVRSNERGVVGFLADYRRLNVAVTRARKHVMLVGDAATIASNTMLGSLYDYACEHGKVLFVQQLLDESGGVPPDPASVAAPQRTSKAEKRLGHGKEQRQEKGLDEQEVRERFERQLRALAERGGSIDFPASLNPFERAMAHEVATSLGLLHESRGEGMERRLLVRTPGSAAGTAGDEGGSAAGASSGSAPATRGKAGPGPGEPLGRVAAEDSETDAERETPLQAFERRAGALIASLGPEEPVAEWKGPTDEELEILERLARQRGLEVELIGSGKKRRCRVALETPPPGNAVRPPPVARPEGGVAGGAAAAPAAPAPNAMLAELHAQKQRRKEEEAAQRRQQNEAAKTELKQAKQAGKQPKVAAAADDDDLDQVLLEFAAKDGICAFGTCREKVNTMIDAVSLCRLCSKRFCLRHAQAEMHGCGDQAQRTEQKKWKQGCDSAMNPRGAGLANKSFGDHRGQAAAKLQDKIKGKEDARSTKKKDGKKK